MSSGALPPPATPALLLRRRASKPARAALPLLAGGSAFGPVLNGPAMLLLVRPRMLALLLDLTALLPLLRGEPSVKYAIPLPGSGRGAPGTSTGMMPVGALVATCCCCCW
jgi:hypothetical protein